MGSRASSEWSCWQQLILFWRKWCERIHPRLEHPQNHWPNLWIPSGSSRRRNRCCRYRFNHCCICIKWAAVSYQSCKLWHYHGYLSWTGNAWTHHSAISNVFHAHRFVLMWTYPEIFAFCLGKISQPLSVVEWSVAATLRSAEAGTGSQLLQIISNHHSKISVATLAL